MSDSGKRETVNGKRPPPRYSNPRLSIVLSVKCQAVERLVMPLLSYIAEARTWCIDDRLLRK